MDRRRFLAGSALAAGLLPVSGTMAATTAAATAPRRLLPVPLATGDTVGLVSPSSATDEPFAPHFDTSALRRVKSYLHFIRTSLLDPQSPLAAFAPAKPEGLTHAS